MKWATVNSAGAITSTGHAPDSTTLDNFTGFTDTVLLNVAEDVDGLTHYYDHGAKVFVRVPACPSDEHYFDTVTKAWVLDVARVEQRVRLNRNRLLAASDWTQLPDSPLVAGSKAPLVQYRQALRDVTKQAGFPTNVVWPTPPADV